MCLAIGELLQSSRCEGMKRSARLIPMGINTKPGINSIFKRHLLVHRHDLI